MLYTVSADALQRYRLMLDTPAHEGVERGSAAVPGGHGGPQRRADGAGAPGYGPVDAREDADLLEAAALRSKQVPFRLPEVVRQEHTSIGQKAFRRLVTVPRDHRVGAGSVRLHHPDIASIAPFGREEDLGTVGRPPAGVVVARAIGQTHRIGEVASKTPDLPVLRVGMAAGERIDDALQAADQCEPAVRRPINALAVNAKVSRLARGDVVRREPLVRLVERGAVDDRPSIWRPGCGKAAPTARNQPLVGPVTIDDQNAIEPHALRIRHTEPHRTEQELPAIRRPVGIEVVTCLAVRDLLAGSGLRIDDPDMTVGSPKRDLAGQSGCRDRARPGVTVRAAPRWGRQLVGRLAGLQDQSEGQ